MRVSILFCNQPITVAVANYVFLASASHSPSGHIVGVGVVLMVQVDLTAAKASGLRIESIKACRASGLQIGSLPISLGLLGPCTYQWAHPKPTIHNLQMDSNFKGQNHLSSGGKKNGG